MTRGVCKTKATYKRWFSARVTHGGYIGGKEQPMHYIWRSMLARCDTKVKNYEHVEVCERWRNYGNFVADMGERPSPKHTLDRWPNPFGNYEPSNCRWATWDQQARNKRETDFFTDGHRVGSIADWAEWLGIGRELARWRWLEKGTFSEGMRFKTCKPGRPWVDVPLRGGPAKFKVGART